jgi:hypothetical protein
MGVLAWLARGASRSVDIFVAARFVMLELFWLNIVLIALATGERLFSRRGLIALVGAATLAPLWDFGFEIRPDNLLLCGVLLMWCVVRLQPKGLQPYVIVGVLTAGLQFVGFGALAFTLPISAAILAFPPNRQPAPRWKLGLAWAAGALGAFVLLRVAYGAAGLWDTYVANLRMELGSLSAGTRSCPGVALSRLLVQTPLLLAVLAAALITVALDLRRRGRAALSWDGVLPEALLFVVALVALLLNPAPERYRLLLLVPFAYLLAFRYASGLVEEFWSRLALRPVLVALLIFGCFVPFGVATWRHVGWTNYNQEARIRLVEALTDATKDPVYDGVGLVPVRSTIGFYWPLPETNRPSLAATQGIRLRDMLAVHPAAAFIPNNRTDGLPEADRAFIKNRYVPLTDDLWVLGKVLPAGGGTFEIVHAGRYRISSLEGSDLAGTYPEGLAGLLAPMVEGTLSGTLDGAPLTNRPVELTVGTHRIETQAADRPAVVWIGPRQERIGRLGDSDHRLLFMRWY